MPEWTQALRARLARLQLTPAREAEVIEELSQHLDDQYEELRSSGASDANAHRLALEELDEAGGLAQRMQVLSQAHTPAIVVRGEPAAHPLRGIWSDVRYAARMVTREPGFAATVVLTLALGIAVNTTIFTVVNASLLRPLPMTGGERMVRLSVVGVEDQDQESGVSYLDFQDWRTAQRAFDDIQAMAERTVAVTDDEWPAARVNAAYVSWNTFSMIGQPPALGRVALGANARRVWWSVTQATLWQLAIGVVLGTAGAAAVATVLPAFLVGTSGGSAAVFAGVVITFVAVGLIASAVPARQATRLDPVAALQAE